MLDQTMKHDNRPLGVFDSGLGGLTVVKELKRQMPHEDIIYFGDTARVPYGSKSPKTVRKYAIEASYLLSTYDVKAIVVACNTASAHGLALLQRRFSVPVFGVIDAGVSAAVRLSRNQSVLVIGTHGTVRSEAYQGGLRRLGGEGLTIWSQPCPLFVPLVEEGLLEGEITDRVIQSYLGRYQRTEVDTVILGCTHYPLLRPAIARLWPAVALVDSGVETAGEVRQSPLFVPAESGRTQGRTRYVLSDFAESFLKIGQLFLGREMHHLEVIDFEHFAFAHQNRLCELYEAKDGE